ncbi:Uncharacterised protein [Collinsella intestinalis]|nr:Uncharacterised protein [Collinsella intestinalis]
MLATSTHPVSSTWRSKRMEASEISARSRLVWEVRPALKQALSTSTSTVASVTSDSMPPMTPASATGVVPASPVAMRPMPAESVRSTSSRVRKTSPSRAARTATVRLPAFSSNALRSKACSGWPVSIIT